MRNLSDFKKRLKVGVLLQATNHLTFSHRGENNKVFYKDTDLGVRPVSIVQPNSFALKTTKLDGSVVDSWCSYPKAKECVFLDSNTIQILEEQRDGILIPVLTYKFV